MLWSRPWPHTQVEEDPDHEFPPTTADDPPLSGPRLIEVGIKGPGAHPTLWRRAWRDKILPAVVNFNPDLILVSAGFDAHRKDVINYRCAQQSCGRSVQQSCGRSVLQQRSAVYCLAGFGCQRCACAGFACTLDPPRQPSVAPLEGSLPCKEHV